LNVVQMFMIGMAIFVIGTVFYLMITNRKEN